MKRARCTILPRCCPPWLDGCWLTNQPPSRVASRARQWCPGVDTFVLDPGQGHTSASRKMAEPRDPRPSAPMNGLAASGSGVAQPGSRALNERAERRGVGGAGTQTPPVFSDSSALAVLPVKRGRGLLLHQLAEPEAQAASPAGRRQRILGGPCCCGVCTQSAGADTGLG